MSNERQRLYENTGPWETDVPADLIPAIKHLRSSFEDAHWACGETTQVFCYSILHNETVDDPAKEYLNYFSYMKARVGPAATLRFHESIKLGTPSAIFKGFYDFYLEGVSVQALAIFKELAEIGLANESRLAKPHLEWAEAQTKHLIRWKNHVIRIWVRNVCDKQVYDPKEDLEERIFWRKWQAPMFLVMKPSRFQPYDALRVWERNDAESSSRLLESFAEHYVLHLEVKLERASGDAGLALAKQPRPVETNTSSNGSREGRPATMATAGRRSTPNNARREARKLNTKAMYESWQRVPPTGEEPPQYVRGLVLEADCQDGCSEGEQPRNHPQKHEEIKKLGRISFRPTR
jgi:hypothetical protein